MTLHLLVFFFVLVINYVDYKVPTWGHRFSVTGLVLGPQSLTFTARSASLDAEQEEGFD